MEDTRKHKRLKSEGLGPRCFEFISPQVLCASSCKTCVGNEDVPHKTLGLQLLDEFDSQLILLLVRFSALLSAFRLRRYLCLFLLRERNDNLQRLRQRLCCNEFGRMVVCDVPFHAGVGPVRGLLSELKDAPLDALERDLRGNLDVVFVYWALRNLDREEICPQLDRSAHGTKPRAKRKISLVQSQSLQRRHKLILRVALQSCIDVRRLIRRKDTALYEGHVNHIFRNAKGERYAPALLPGPAAASTEAASVPTTATVESSTTAIATAPTVSAAITASITAAVAAATPAAIASAIPATAPTSVPAAVPSAVTSTFATAASASKLSASTTPVAAAAAASVTSITHAVVRMRCRLVVSRKERQRG